MKLVHQLRMGYITIREDHLVYLKPGEQLRQFFLRVDGNPLRIVRARKLSRIGPIRDVRICVAVKATT